MTEALILRVDESDRLAVALVLMVWVSGITLAFVDNVPLTTMMIRVVTSLGTKPNLNLPMTPLIWALSFGVCLGEMTSEVDVHPAGPFVVIRPRYLKVMSDETKKKKRKSNLY